MGDEVRRTQGGQQQRLLPGQRASAGSTGACSSGTPTSTASSGCSTASGSAATSWRREPRLRASTSCWSGPGSSGTASTLDRPDWSDHSHSLAFTLRSSAARFLLHGMFNAYWEPLTFELPPAPDERLTLAALHRHGAGVARRHLPRRRRAAGHRRPLRRAAALGRRARDGVRTEAVMPIAGAASRTTDGGRSLDFTIARLGDCLSRVADVGRPLRDRRRTRPLSVDAGRVAATSRRSAASPPAMELRARASGSSSTRRRIACGIVTCGGLCPGLNDVIRAIVLSLHHHYGVQTIYGFRYGFEGLVEASGHEPLRLTPDSVSRIHNSGGSILGSSRGPQKPAAMVDYASQSSASASSSRSAATAPCAARMRSAEEATRQGPKIAVIGVPKTIDNDVSFVQKTFGFETAVTEARRATYAANTEAEGARNGDRPREADGPRLGVHRRVLRARRRPGELLPGPRSPVHAASGCSPRCASGSNTAAMPSSSSPRGRARISWPRAATATPRATSSTGTSGSSCAMRSRDPSRNPARRSP